MLIYQVERGIKMDYVKSNFPKNLSYLRKQKGMTQAELANKINVDQTTIGRWEDGNREPTVGNVANISDVFNVSIPDLLNKDLTINDNQELNQQEILFNKHKDLLSESDWAIINTIIEQKKKEIDKQLGED